LKSVAAASRDKPAKRSCFAGDAARSSRARRIADGFGSVTHKALSPLRAHFTAEQYSVSAVSAAGPAAIEVCVHRRALDDVAVGGVSVVVLRTELPADPATWAAMPVPDLPNLQVVMDIAPAGGEPLPPAVVLPAGWAAADQPLAIRRPARPAGTARPVVVTFRMDLTGAAPGSRWLLLAMVRAGASTLDLTAGATLSDLVRRSPHVAARSFQVL